MWCSTKGVGRLDCRFGCEYRDTSPRTGTAICGNRSVSRRRRRLPTSDGAQKLQATTSLRGKEGNLTQPLSRGRGCGARRQSPSDQVDELRPDNRSLPWRPICPNRSTSNTVHCGGTTISQQSLNAHQAPFRSGQSIFRHRLISQECQCRSEVRRVWP